MLPYRRHQRNKASSSRYDDQVTPIIDTSEDVSSNQSSENEVNLKTSKVEDFIELPFKRVIATHKYCLICRAETNLSKIAFEARCQSFLKRRIFIPSGNRCCNIHLIGKRFFENELMNLRVYSNSSSVAVN